MISGTVLLEIPGSQAAIQRYDRPSATARMTDSMTNKGTREPSVPQVFSASTDAMRLEPDSRAELF